MQKPVDVSVVIPLFNEEESLVPLTKWIFKALEDQHFSFEILFVDDGSTDKSWETLKKVTQQHSNIQGIRFSKNFGKSQALHAGFEASQGEYVVTLDADLQDSPEEIPKLIKGLKEEGYDLIS